MCGVVGYIGKNNTLLILASGLKKLEYRGYDSCGIAFSDNKKIKCIKIKGRIKDLEEELSTIRTEARIGIGHTRWATHGKPEKKNAHPFFDCKKEIVVVHNGIIENFYDLKDLLEKEGHKFKSETDSEVIAHLIEKFYSNNLEEALLKSLKLIKGTFSLLVFSKKEEKIIGARRGMSLIVGLKNKEKFIASDIVAIIENTNEVIYLDDNEIAIIDKDDCIVKDFNGKKISKKINKINWDFNRTINKNYKNFTLKEIFEQPEVIKNTLLGKIENKKIKLDINIDVKSIKRIVITACGTSWHSALLGKHFIEELIKIPVEVDYASEFRYRNPILRKDDLFIVISQSGETADTLAALEMAKKEKIKTLGIVNTVGSTISLKVDNNIFLNAGPEIGVASTKAFTSQVLILFLFSLYLKEKLTNKKTDNKIIKEIYKISDNIEKVLKKDKEIKNLARRFKDRNNFLFLGRKLNFPVALEGALKLKEVSYIHAEGYPAAEMKHGPIALIDKNMPVVFISPKDDTYNKILSNMQEIKARGGEIIAITNDDDKNIDKLSKYIIKVPKTIYQLAPIINTIPLQLLAYYIADLKGIDVDKPRNLAKSVTVE